MSDEIVKTDRELAPGKSDELKKVLEDKPVVVNAAGDVIGAVSGAMSSEILPVFGEVVTPSEKQWVCAKCNYMNVGPICTKCGSAILRHLTIEQIRELMEARACLLAAGETFDEFEESKRRREAALAEAPLRCNFWTFGERCDCLAGHEGSHGSPEGWAEVQRALKSGSFSFRETLDDYVGRKK